MTNTPSQKSLYTLRPGEAFPAMVEDIRPGFVVIRLTGGGQFQARTLRPPQARIGQVSLFLVKENDLNGRIALEILPPRGESDRIVKGIFARAGKSTGDAPLGVCIFEETGLDGDKLIAAVDMAKGLGLGAGDDRLAAFCALMPTSHDRLASLQSILDDDGLFSGIYSVFINTKLPPGEASATGNGDTSGNAAGEDGGGVPLPTASKATLPIFVPGKLTLRNYYIQLTQRLLTMRELDHFSAHSRMIDDALNRIRFMIAPPRKFFQVMMNSASPTLCSLHISSETQGIIVYNSARLGRIEARIDIRPGHVLANFSVIDRIQDVVKTALQQKPELMGLCRVSKLTKATSILDVPIPHSRVLPTRHTFDVRV